MRQNPQQNSAIAFDEPTSSQREVGLLTSLEVSKISRGIMGGDPAAFTTFYQAVFTRLYRYLLVCSHGQESLVQEALQETMLRVLKHIKPFSTEKDIWAWLCCVARSALVDLVRKEQRHQQHLQALTRSEQETNGELQEHLCHCLNELETEDRALIEGKYYQAQTYQALAVTCRMTPKAVESRLARIRKKLKTLLLTRLHHDSSAQ